MKKLIVSDLEPKAKHPTIFEWFKNLAVNESFIIVNDHDPKPLFYQFKAEYPGEFEWEYLEQGPQRWEVKIKKIKKSKTIQEIIVENPKSIEVFKEFGIDYCCGGKKDFELTLKEKGIDQKVFFKKLKNIETSGNLSFIARYNKWSLSFLCDFIIENHHNYLKNIHPEILQLSDKVMNVHSTAHPELIEINKIINALENELTMHMQKEENILFPAIKEIERNKNAALPFGSIRNPISMMIYEHESAGNNIEKIKKLTMNFTIPADACASYSLLYRYLKDYYDDLHQHIHLENNILFPRAIKLQDE